MPINSIKHELITLLPLRLLLIQYIMRTQSLSVLLLYLHQALALTIRQEHQLTTSANHDYFFAGQVFQTFQLIGVIVVIVGVGVCCFYCRGFFSRQDGAPTTVVVQRERQQNRVAARRYEPVDDQPAPVRTQPKNNAILQHFASQKVTTTSPLSQQPFKQSVSPYAIDKHEPSPFSKWQPLSSTITSCGVCNLFNKGNEVPMMQVECLEDHCFHFRCLSQYRSKMVLDMGGNGLNKCPKCKETYSPIVKIFCPSCKRMAIAVNLVEQSNSDTGQIQTKGIISKFGSSCQNCRGV